MGEAIGWSLAGAVLVVGGLRYWLFAWLRRVDSEWEAVREQSRRCVRSAGLLRGALSANGARPERSLIGALSGIVHEEEETLAAGPRILQSQLSAFLPRLQHLDRPDHPVSPELSRSLGELTKDMAVLDGGLDRYNREARRYRALRNRFPGRQVADLFAFPDRDCL